MSITSLHPSYVDCRLCDSRHGIEHVIGCVRSCQNKTSDKMTRKIVAQPHHLLVRRVSKWQSPPRNRRSRNPPLSRTLLSQKKVEAWQNRRLTFLLIEKSEHVLPK